MTTAEIIKALKCCETDVCDTCPIYQHFLENNKDPDIDQFYCEEEIHAIAARALEDCNNELCYKCGKYKEAHLGACNGCRWKI